MDKDYFEQYMSSLDRLYEYDPVEAVEKAAKFYDKLSRKVRLLPYMDDKKLDTLLVCLGCILIALCGFINFDDGLYYVGLLFFLAGFLVGLYVPGFGLIFLITHGGIGFSIIAADGLSAIKNSPLLSDGSILNNPYVVSIYSLLGFSILLLVLQNLIPKIRNIRHIKPIIVFMFLLGLFLLRLAPYKLG